MNRYLNLPSLALSTAFHSQRGSPPPKPPKSVPAPPPPQPPSGGGGGGGGSGDISLSIEETNKIRAKLGLKPLKVQ